MAASDGLPRAWQTATLDRRSIVWRRGRRTACRRVAQPMAAEAGSARGEGGAVEEAGLAREARPAVEEAISVRGGAAGGCGAVFSARSGGRSGANLLLSCVLALPGCNIDKVLLEAHVVP
uniref:Uncharacterized protein n=1 Tax=Oryza glumipatula TaxID=40148 RepID=A0A0D9YG12_9ORYZ